MYLGHRQYDMAREYFNLVIDGYPQSQEASFAANLIISSYQKELDWAMVQVEADDLLDWLWTRWRSARRFCEVRAKCNLVRF